MLYLNRPTWVRPIVGTFSNKSVKMTDAVGVLVCSLLPTMLTAMTASTFSGWLTVLITPKLQCFANGQSNVFQEKSVHYLCTTKQASIKPWKQWMHILLSMISTLQANWVGHLPCDFPSLYSKYVHQSKTFHIPFILRRLLQSSPVFSSTCLHCCIMLTICIHPYTSHDRLLPAKTASLHHLLLCTGSGMFDIVIMVLCTTRKSILSPACFCTELGWPFLGLLL